ncbi:MAG TPA: tetratricopeptide repeat protein [Thauera aminoaromatica]|nr:tetratricopeptide repeat protein [Thauera sp.]MBX3681297.1 tetratricopeptide repeat protein [Thauera sp.]HMZ28955.1 tetratricopeptide repeat protein [Thauera aminoaromatica]HNB05247.1 tetratricopeptide repeat protein [Thauera aminoaromatica]
MVKVLRAAVLLAGSIAMTGASAGTEADYQALRAWCVQRLQNQNNAAWQAANNPQKYFHFHHFCFGMQWENKVVGSASQKERERYVGSIVNETSYIISHAARSHFLMPEVYFLRGWAQYYGKQHIEAESALLNALQLDPRHARAAAQLATLYRATDRRAKAAEVVRTALKLSPNDFRLRKMGEEFGVELPPLVRPPAPKPAAPAEPSQAEPADAAPATTEATVTQEAATAARSAAQVDQDAGTAEGASQGCRFCPPAEIQKRWRESFGEPQKP